MDSGPTKGGGPCCMIWGCKRSSISKQNLSAANIRKTVLICVLHTVRLWPYCFESFFLINCFATLDLSHHYEIMIIWCFINTPEELRNPSLFQTQAGSLTPRPQKSIPQELTAFPRQLWAQNSRERSSLYAMVDRTARPSSTEVG